MAMKGTNVVNVVSIDEERLKFRVNIALVNRNGAPGAGTDGTYPVELPIPTFFGNSNEYNSALIKCVGFGALCPGAFADPAWSVGVPGAARQFLKMSAVEIQLDIPSSQSTTITNGGAVAGAVLGDILGQSRIGGFREVMFLKVVNVGDGNGNFDLAASGRCACWQGTSDSDPLLCGNPFGKVLTITNKFPINDETCYLASVAGGGGAGGVDIGEYCYTFDITMIPNK